jgi:leader peptidase (prepilin peptidase)/N-methyltransferase
VGALGTILVAVGGLIVGRSLNAFIVRISLRLVEEEREAGWELDYTPPAHRPDCIARADDARPFAWYRCLPLISYRTLRLRCRICGAWRSLRYPIVEVATAAIAVALYATATGPAALVLYEVLAAALVVVTVVDLDFQIIPDSITLPGIALGLVAGPLLGHIGIRDAIIGMAVGGGVIWGIGAAWSLLRGVEAMGLGDVKLLAMVGTIVGWQGAIYTLFVGSVVGSVVGSAVILSRRQRLDTAIPFGPFLAAGALLYLLSGTEPTTRLLDWYVELVRRLL